MVVLAEDLLAEVPGLGSARLTATANLAAELRHTVVVHVEDLETIVRARNFVPFGPLRIPALRVERQADLTTDALGALCSVKAAHRALMVSPREDINLHLALCIHATERHPGQRFIARTCERRPELPDLVIVRGPTGPDAWPMHPAWVRSVRDQCAEAGVAFAFLGWGDFIPEQNYPPEIDGYSKRKRAWLDRRADPTRERLTPYRAIPDPMPVPEGGEGAWWGKWWLPEGSPGREGIITDWGAMDTDGIYLSTWTTGWHDSQRFCRVGPRRSGRLLDGVEHLALPDGLCEVTHG
jgi:hypothetical protein